MTKPLKIFLGIPSTHSRVDAQTFLLRRIEKKYAGRVELVYPEECVHRIFHDYARNGCVEEFLKTDCDLIWFLDSDIVPPTDVLDMILDNGDEWKVAGAAYPVFMTPEGYDSPQVVFCVYNKGANGGLHAARLPKSGTDYVDGVATGCMFIKREVFSQLQKPYFEFKYEAESRQLIEGEDLGFCLKVNKLGYRFLTDYAKVCKHYKTIDLLDANNYAIQFANTAVINYDKRIRGQVEALVARTQAKKPKSSLILP